MTHHFAKLMFCGVAAFFISHAAHADGQTTSKNQDRAKKGSARPVNIEEPTPSPARLLPTRKFTWAEIETILEKLRAERKGRPQAFDDLRSWYSYLSSPVYSESKDYPTHLLKLAEWRKQFPKSSNPLVVIAKTYIAYAWQARGSGFAPAPAPRITAGKDRS